MYNMIGRPPLYHLFPYTTLFRSRRDPQLLVGDFDPVQCHVEIAACEQVEQHVPLALHGARPDAELGGERRREIDLRSEEHTSELQSRFDLVCRLLLEKKNRPYRR